MRYAMFDLESRTQHWHICVGILWHRLLISDISDIACSHLWHLWHRLLSSLTSLTSPALISDISDSACSHLWHLWHRLLYISSLTSLTSPDASPAIYNHPRFCHIHVHQEIMSKGEKWLLGGPAFYVVLCSSMVVLKVRSFYFQK